jgi:hypothetical protein
MNLAKALASVGGLTLASRVLGLVRDSLFARFVGAGFASDAFLIAFRLPNMFRALFAEGAFASAFIPMFNTKVADPDGTGLPTGITFAEQALSVLLPILIVMTVALEVLAWPVPRGRREPPAEAATGGSAPAVHRAGEEEWFGLREFRSGDSPRQVAWGAYARGRGLLVKTYQSPAAHHRTFDLAHVPAVDIEARLEQLSAWIVAAHARGERYAVVLGDVVIPPDTGSRHREHCLRELALHGAT